VINNSGEKNWYERYYLSPLKSQSLKREHRKLFLKKWGPV